MQGGGGSIWSSEYINTVSNTGNSLDDLLEEKPTLEEVLLQDEVIQECKAMNSLLVDYLCEPVNIHRLVQFITWTSPSSDHDQEECQRLSFVASELFACEVVAMLDALLRHEQAMETLFDFVSPDKVLDAKLAGYFRKVVGVLIQRKYEDLSEYLERHEHVLSNLLYHLDSTSIMEVIIMLGWDDGFYQHSNDITWLVRLKLIPQIVDRLGSHDFVSTSVNEFPNDFVSTSVNEFPNDSVINSVNEFPNDAVTRSPNDSVIKSVNKPSISQEKKTQLYSNAAYTLVDVITKSPPTQESPLLNHLHNPAVLRRLLDNVLQQHDDDDTCFVHGARVLIALLQRIVQFEHQLHDDSGMEWEINPVISGIIARLQLVQSRLVKVPENVTLPTSFGELSPPLGQVRLRAAELCCNLIQFDTSVLQDKMAELRLIPSLLDVFFAYPWHNVLHNLVESAIHIIFAADPDRMKVFRESLLIDGKLLERILSLHRENVIVSQENGGFRLGSMAFVTRIGLVLEERLGQDEELKDMVGQNDEWDLFVNGALRDEQERLTTVLGGHRPSSSVAADSEDEGLDFVTFGNSSGGFGGSFDQVGLEIQDEELWQDYDAESKWGSFPDRDIEIVDPSDSVMEVQGSDPVVI